MTQIAKESKHAQVNVEEGIRRYGERAVQAIFNKYAQLDNKDTFSPEDESRLIMEQKRETLKLITILKERRCVKVKDRACADSKKQRRYISKEEASSPMIQMESLFLSLLINAKEGRDIATADVVGVYLLTEMEDNTLVKLTGESVDIMCKVNDKYKHYVLLESDKPVLYLKLKETLYGCIMSALLWYQIFVKVLLDLGFVLNRYDACVANMKINGSQYTVCWYVDDNKISHKDPKVVDSVITELEKKFDKITVTRGKEHNFVGMDIVFRSDNKIKVTMKEYLRESIKAFTETITKSARTPARGDLFSENEDENKIELDEREGEVFHRIFAKLLYVAKRARPDIALAVSFLCMRVAELTKGDRHKFKHLLGYINSTIDMVRVIGASRNEMLQTWVDASYAVHRNMKSHTGGTMSLGHCTFHNRLVKQKIHTKSSTEAELVGASERLITTKCACQILAQTQD